MSLSTSPMRTLRALLQSDARFPFTFYFLNHPVFDDGDPLIDFRWRHSDCCRIHALVMYGIHGLMDVHAGLLAGERIRALFPATLTAPRTTVSRDGLYYMWRPTPELFLSLRDWFDAAAIAETTCALQDKGFISRELCRARIESYRAKLANLLALEDYMPLEGDALTPKEAVVCASLMASFLQPRGPVPDSQWKRLVLAQVCAPPTPYCSCVPPRVTSKEYPSCDSE